MISLIIEFPEFKCSNCSRVRKTSTNFSPFATPKATSAQYRIRLLRFSTPQSQIGSYFEFHFTRVYDNMISFVTCPPNIIKPRTRVFRVKNNWVLFSFGFHLFFSLSLYHLNHVRYNVSGNGYICRFPGI